MPLLLVALMLALGNAQQDDLAIPIARVDTTVRQHDDLEVAITLENQSEVDWVVNLGYMLSNGRTMFPTALTLMLTDANGGTRIMSLWTTALFFNVLHFTVP